MEAWNRARFKWLCLVIPGRATWREPGIHFSEHPGGAMDSGLDAFASPRNDGEMTEAL